MTLGLLAAAGCDVPVAERIGNIYDLKRNPTPENLEQLRALLEDEDRDVRATALNALVTLDVDDAAGIALAGLRDGDGFVRSTAAKLIGDMGDPSLAGVLVTRLAADPVAVVRQRAAESLAVLGGEEAVGGLVHGLNDPDQGVRLAAVKGLRDQAPGAAIEDLSSLLLEDAVWEIRVQAATALGLSGDPAVASTLREALGDPSEFVRSAVANALRVLGEPLDAPGVEAAD